MSESTQTETDPHQELLRTDSGNSSITTDSDTPSLPEDSVSGYNSATAAEPEYSEEEEVFVYRSRHFHLSIFVPEIGEHFDVTCPSSQSIWSLKRIILEHTGKRLQLSSPYNYGFFCSFFNAFLDEQYDLINYYPDNLQLTGVEIDPEIKHNILKNNWLDDIHQPDSDPSLISLDFLPKHRPETFDTMATLTLCKFHNGSLLFFI